MLANVLVTVVFVGLAVTATVTTTYAAARAAIHRKAQTYAGAAYAEALTHVRDAIASAVAQGAPMPSFTPTPPQPVCASNGASCAFYASESVTLQTSASIQSNMEADANVYEDRIRADIVVTILTPDRTAVAVRERFATFRTLKTPPYAVIAGARDATSESTARAAEGDDGGLPAGAANASCSPAPADDTLVRAQYYNDATGECTDASAWRSQPAVRATSSAHWSP